MDKRLLRLALGGLMWGVLASSPVCAQTVNSVVQHAGTTGNNPSFTAQGPDANIGLILTPKGTGEVGIGTATPQSLLHVYNGEVQVGSSGASCAAANAGAIRFSGSALYYCNGTSWVINGSGAAAGSTGYVQFNGGSGAFAADSNFFWDNTNKRLGIGTASPAGILEVEGGTATSGEGNNVKIYAQNAASGGYSGGNIILVPGTNSSGAPTYAGVLIGTTTGEGQSGYALTVNGSIAMEGNRNLQIDSGGVRFYYGVTGFSSNQASKNTFSFTNSNGYGVGVAINGSTSTSNLDVYGNVAIGTSYAGVTAAPTNGAIIQGKVGIGTTTPLDTLTVNGTVGYMLGSDLTTTGAQSDVALSGSTALRYNGTAAASQQAIAEAA